jgi:hypothetical protein
MEDVVEVIKGPLTARFPDALWACSKRLYRMRPLRVLPARPAGLLDLTDLAAATTAGMKVVRVASADAIAAHPVIPGHLADVTFFIGFDVLADMADRGIPWPRGMASVRVTVWTGGLSDEVIRVADATFRARSAPKPKAVFRVAGRVEGAEDLWRRLRDATA